MYAIYLEPILEKTSQEYKNVLCVDKKPKGPLSNLVTQLNTSKLSIFHSNSQCGCKYVFHKIENDSDSSNDLKSQGFFPKITCKKMQNNCYMGEDDITDLLSFCIDNGYRVDMDLTKILMKANVAKMNRKVICVICDQQI